MLELKYLISIENGWLRPMILVMLAWFVASAAFGADIGDTGVASTVMADRRSGRLVRRVVVSDRVIAARTIQPLAVKPGEEVRVASAPESISDAVDSAAAAHGVDPLLVHAVIHVESAYNRLAVSPKGAEGLMQLIPATARRFGVGNSFDSRQNVEGGVKYLRELQDRFSDLRLVLAAYNAGEEAVERYKGIPPYLETREYVYKVGKRYGELRRAQRRREPPQQSAGLRSAEVPDQYRPLEASFDAAGRLSLRTR
jgi:soluble lytic murein transglycosylase-like protein